MVKKMTFTASKLTVTAVLLFSSISISAFAADECGSESKPCERARPHIVIRTLKTTGVGQLAPGFQHSEHPCSQFRLTRTQVRHYFSAAGRITQNAMQYVVDESACVVVGVVKLSNGTSYQFSIGELRDGKMIGASEEIEYLYCSKCESPPFFQ